MDKLERKTLMEMTHQILKDNAYVKLLHNFNKPVS